jgi:hypothetical protein
MRRSIVVLVVVVAAVAGDVGAGTAFGADDDYRPYALIRERMKSCLLDRQWHPLSVEARRNCRRLRKLYVFYVYPGDRSARGTCTA